MSSNVCEFFVEGMHCAACEIVVEKKLSTHSKVRSAKARLNSQTVEVLLEDETLRIEDLNHLLAGSGYVLHTSRVPTENLNKTELGKAFIISLGFISFFVILQKLGIVNLVSSNQVTLPFVFMIGIVASLSSCMAVVGGLVLSISSSFAKYHKNSSIPIVKFHLARLISFFLLGGLIGILGSAFTLSAFTTLLLNFILFVVMFILGISLLRIFPSIAKFQFRAPRILSDKLDSAFQKNSYVAPVFLGISTFFLPCGFTQSIQIYSLTTGNFLNGAVTMLVFALGTLPILGLISFASIKLAKGLQSSLFFKTAGFIILFFALLNFIGTLAAIGLISPILNI